MFINCWFSSFILEITSVVSYISLLFYFWLVPAFAIWFLNSWNLLLRISFSWTTSFIYWIFLLLSCSNYSICKVNDSFSLLVNLSAEATLYLCSSAFCCLSASSFFLAAASISPSSSFFSWRMIFNSYNESICFFNEWLLISNSSFCYFNYATWFNRSPTF